MTGTIVDCAACGLPTNNLHYAYVVGARGRLARKRVCGPCMRRTARIAITLDVPSSAAKLAAKAAQERRAADWNGDGRPQSALKPLPLEEDRSEAQLRADGDWEDTGRAIVFCAACDFRIPEPATDDEAMAQGWCLVTYRSTSGEPVRAWRCPEHWHRRTGDGVPPDFAGSPTWKGSVP